MIRHVVPSILVLFSALGVVGFGKLEGRLADLDRRPAVHPAAFTELEGELEGLAGELSELSEKLAASRENELTEAVLRLERGFGSAQAELADADTRIEVLEAFGSRIDPETVDERLAQLAERLEESQRELQRLQELETRIDGESQVRLAELQESFEARLASLTTDRSTERLWSELLAPSVQILGDTTVGSGVLLRSRLVTDENTAREAAAGASSVVAEYRTYALTAWHVVRDVYGGSAASFHPVPVKVYDVHGNFETLEADLVISNAEIDVALLEIRSKTFRTDGVALASRGSLASASVFDPIYAVGCPLGNDPIPTSGEVASIAHEIDGVEYWMISAPTYIGNSGGGVFDSKTHELLGIFSKIYTHGSMRSTIVPHMGLATPIERVYDWLEENGFAHVLRTETENFLVNDAAHEPDETASVDH